MRGMIQSIRISGYRSLRDLRLRLGRVTLLSGANGVGKTNIYRALRLVSSLARGGFAEAVAGEGGMRSLLWTGNMDHARLTTLSAAVESEAFNYAFECGLMPAAPGDLTKFKLDPDIKTEELRYGRRLLAKRTRNQVRVADAKGVMHSLSEPPGASESMLTLVRDLKSCPRSTQPGALAFLPHDAHRRRCTCEEAGAGLLVACSARGRLQSSCCDPKHQRVRSGGGLS